MWLRKAEPKLQVENGGRHPLSALAAGYSLNVVEREPELNALRQDPGYRDASLHAKEKKSN